jgi:hypothetical protein
MGKQAKKQRKAEAEARERSVYARGSARERHRDKDTRRRPFQSSPPAGSLRGSSGTGERDATYDLLSVLYHALQGAEACGRYLLDAEAVDDEELAEFFEDTRTEYAARAKRARRLLAGQLLEEGESGTSDEDADASGELDMEEDEEDEEEPEDEP